MSSKYPEGRVRMAAVIPAARNARRRSETQIRICARAVAGGAASHTVSISCSTDVTRFGCSARTASTARDRAEPTSTVPSTAANSSGPSSLISTRPCFHGGSPRIVAWIPPNEPLASNDSGWPAVVPRRARPPRSCLRGYPQGRRPRGRAAADPGSQDARGNLRRPVADLAGRGLGGR